MCLAEQVSPQSAVRVDRERGRQEAVNLDARTGTPTRPRARSSDLKMQRSLRAGDGLCARCSVCWLASARRPQRQETFPAPHALPKRQCTCKHGLFIAPSPLPQGLSANVSVFSECALLLSFHLLQQSKQTKELNCYCSMADGSAVAGLLCCGERKCF